MLPILPIRNRVTPRTRRGLQRWFLLCGLVLTTFGWLPASAQTPTAPATVVLPPVQMHIPLVYGESTKVATCPLTSNNLYKTTPILGNPRNPDRPALFDPDLNLQVRGYRPITATLGLVNINGPTDDDAPQLAHLFRPVRVPTFSAVHQVYNWDWECCPGGKLGVHR